MALVNTYFDFDDYDNPIKTYLTSLENLFMTNDGKTRWFEAFIQENEAYTSDGIFYQESYEKTKFYSVHNTAFRTMREEHANNSLAFISFAMAQETVRYERNSYTFIDMIGFIGGLYDSFFLLGFWIVIFFQTKAYYYRMITKLYQVDAFPQPLRKDSEMKKTKRNLDLYVSKESPSLQINEEEKSDIQDGKFSMLSNDRLAPLPNVSSPSFEESFPEPEDYKSQNELMGEVTREIKQRRAFKYNWYHLLPDCK